MWRIASSVWQAADSFHDVNAGVFVHGDQPLLVIEPQRGLHFLDVRAVWRARELLFVFASRDVRLRYTQTALGVIWALGQPIASAALFAVIFGLYAKMPSAGVAYPAFVLAGLLPWQLFVSATSSAATSALSAQALITKVWFPRAILPLAAVLSAVVDFFVALPVLAVVIVWAGVPLTTQLLLWPLAFLLVVGSAFAAGTLLCALTIAYRDFRHTLPFLMQLWMFATPVIYPEGIVPEALRPLLFLNPVTGGVHLFRAAALGTAIDTTGVLLSCVSAVVMLIAGSLAFARLERRIADVL